MKVNLGFGNKSQSLYVNNRNVTAVLTANPVKYGLTGTEEVRRALGNPIGSAPLQEIVKPGETIAIIASDITRPCPTWKILPCVLDELYSAGISRDDITLVFAMGNHRKHSEAERKKLAGPAYGQIYCRDSNPNDCVHMGMTSHGTPVDIDQGVAAADRRICLGNIEYHYFAGYSGGAKAIMPGVSSRAAIQANHSRMVLPEACVGTLETNPIRMDIEEAGKICGVDFIVNVVLDPNQEIVHASAGDVTVAHRDGCKFIDSMYRVDISERADIVVVSQGGAPKDLNLYQVQKALNNAKHAVRPGGIIILVGSCREGLGNKVFEEWLLNAKKPSDLIRRIQKDFQLGAHKAVAIAMVLEQAEIDLVSEMNPNLVRRCFLKPYSTVQAAFDHAMKKMGPAAKVIIMPYGGSTLPHITCETNE